MLQAKHTVWCNATMDLKTYLKSLPDDAARRAFAERVGSTIGHLRNVGYGYKPCATDLAVRIERDTAGAVRRPELRTDWADHWPELVGMHLQQAAA